MPPRHIALATTLFALSACRSELPSLDTDGRFVRWGAVDGADVACQGLADRADAYIVAVHELIGEPVPEGVIAHYYFDPEMSLYDECDHLQACALYPSHPNNRSGKVVEIYAREPLNYHELAHAVHQSLVGQPKSTLLGEAFATYFENDDPAFAALGPASLPIPLETLVEDDDPSFADALTIGAAIGQTHGAQGFWQAFVASQDAEGLGALDTAFESSVGMSLSQTVNDYLGMPVCEATPLACASEPLSPSGGSYQVEIPSACELEGGAIGPLSEDGPYFEYRFTLDFTEPTAMQLQKPAGVELEYIECAYWCEPGSGGLGSPLGDTADEQVFGPGRWEIRASYDAGELGDGVIRVEPQP